MGCREVLREWAGWRHDAGLIGRQYSYQPEVQRATHVHFVHFVHFMHHSTPRRRANQQQLPSGKHALPRRPLPHVQREQSMPCTASREMPLPSGLRLNV